MTGAAGFPGKDGRLPDIMMVVALESEENAVNLFNSGIFIFSMKKQNKNKTCL